MELFWNLGCMFPCGRARIVSVKHKRPQLSHQNQAPSVGPQVIVGETKGYVALLKLTRGMWSKGMSSCGWKFDFSTDGIKLNF